MPINTFNPYLRGDILRMTADSCGRLVVPEPLEDQLAVFQPGGARAFTVQPQSNSVCRLRYPAGVTCDAADNIYVADLGHNRVSKFTSTGVFVASTLTAGQHGLFNPHDVHLSARNQLLYSHVSARHLRVFCFSDAA